MLAFLGELEGGVSGSLGRFSMAQVELEAGEQSRKPPAGHHQVPVLGRGQLAGEEAVKVTQAPPHAHSEHVGCGAGVVPAVPVHGPVQPVQRASTDAGGLGVFGQLHRLGCVVREHLQLAGGRDLGWVGQQLRWWRRGSLLRRDAEPFPVVPLTVDEREEGMQHPARLQLLLAPLHELLVRPQETALDGADRGVISADAPAELPL
jgi:hypothetical protein